MVKHTQRIRRLLPTNYLNVFDHFVGLAFKGLTSKINCSDGPVVLNSPYPTKMESGPM